MATKISTIPNTDGIARAVGGVESALSRSMVSPQTWWIANREIESGGYRFGLSTAWKCDSRKILKIEHRYHTESQRGDPRATF